MHDGVIQLPRTPSPALFFFFLSPRKIKRKTNQGDYGPVEARDWNPTKVHQCVKKERERKNKQVLTRHSSVPYAVLCNTFEQCEATTKRLEITENLVTLFVKVMKTTPEGLLELLYMCINKVRPIHKKKSSTINDLLFFFKKKALS